jgi:hypothetical protein
MPDIIPGSIVDGFQYNLFLQNFPENYYPLALSQLEPFRRARGYRPRWYTVPDADNLGAIPDYATIEEQIRIAPGSWLWGMSAALITSAVPPFPFMPINPSAAVMVQITDGSTGLKLFSDFVAAGFIWSQPDVFGAGGVAPPYLWVDNAPYILSQPRPIVEPGFVNVEISNLLVVAPGTMPNALVQLVLYCMEPVVLVDGILTECQEPAPGAYRGRAQ